MTQEVTTHSWFSRIGNSIKGILFGFVLFVGSFFVLTVNENMAVKDYIDLNEVQRFTEEISADTIRRDTEGKRVQLSDKATTDNILRDEDFGIEVNAINLHRDVEMYQWQEQTETKREEKVGGSVTETKTFTYKKIWSSSVIDSSAFKESATHENPGDMPYHAYSDHADVVNVGAYRVGRDLLRRFTFSTLFRPNRARLPAGATLHEDKIYVGADPTSPSIGDVRISFRITPQDDVSIIAEQRKGELVPAKLSSGRSYSRVEQGNKTLDEMVSNARSEVKLRTWILRFVGFVLMGMGISLIFRPLVVLADVVPLFGNIVGAGVGFVSFSVAAILSLTTIAIAWIAYRPYISFPLLAVAAGVLFFLWKRSRDKRQVNQAGLQAPAGEV